MAKRVGFATRLGAIAAAVGSAVGLGNIWRFPYEAGVNGGGAFILVYICCILVMGIPVILSEFIIGRSTHSNMKAALRRLSPGKKYYLFTYVCIIGSFVVIGFYSVVCGWIIEYLYQAAMGNLDGHTSQEYCIMFNSLVASPWRCVGWTLLFLVLNFIVMSRGIEKGIERVASDRHHWYDVAAGAALGVGITELTWWLSDIVFPRQKNSIAFGTSGTTIDIIVAL